MGGSDLEKSPRASCCVCGKLLARRTRHVFFSFFFFFSETGRQHCSEEDWSFRLLGTLCPSMHSRDRLEPLQIRRVV